MFKPPVAALFFFSAFLAHATDAQPEYLLELKPSYSTHSLNAGIAAAGYEVKENFEAFGTRWAVVRPTRTSSGKMQTSSLESLAFVENAEPNHRYELAMGSKGPAGPSQSDLKHLDPRPILSNDTSFNRLWGVLNYGQSLQKKGIAGMDAAVAQAWAVGRNAKEVVVGVFDTGIDAKHRELQGQLWNKHYNAVQPGSPINDAHSFSHGTHVSGTIAARIGNNTGIAGVAPNAKISMIKIFHGDSSSDTASILRALSWSYENRDTIRVLNHSWIGSGNSNAMREAFQKIDDAGVINVFAAGNSNTDLDLNTRYPAGFRLKNAIIVAAHDSQGKKSTFSSYGAGTVDLAAPGEDIFSLAVKNKMQSLFGTSMAAPHVSGAVAYVWGLNPHLSAAQVRERIVQSGTPTPDLEKTSIKARRLNVLGAVLGETN